MAIGAAALRFSMTINWSSPCQTLTLVAQTLMRLGVGVGPIERSAVLGLALLRDLDNVDRGGPHAPAGQRHRAATGALRRAKRPTMSATDLDLLI